MEENRKQKPSDFKDINDDQERLSLQLSSIWDKELIDSQKNLRELHKLKLMQFILYPLIIFGIIAIFIFILQGINLLIITIDFIIVAIYLISLKYIYAFRKPLKITKKDSKHFTNIKKKGDNQSISQTIIYSFIIIATIFILILSMIGINPLIIFIIFGVSLLYIYFDIDVEDDQHF